MVDLESGPGVRDVDADNGSLSIVGAKYQSGGAITLPVE